MWGAAFFVAHYAGQGVPMRIETEVRLDFKDVLIRPKRSTLSVPSISATAIASSIRPRSAG